MRIALDILYSDAKVLEENAFTCLDNAYDKHVAHQATHQVSLDTARTKRADPRRLEEYGAKFNKARGIWEVPAFKSLLPFMPYISEATCICLYPGIFARVGERMQSRMDAELETIAKAKEYRGFQRAEKVPFSNRLPRSGSINKPSKGVPGASKNRNRSDQLCLWRPESAVKRAKMALFTM